MARTDIFEPTFSPSTTATMPRQDVAPKTNLGIPGSEWYDTWEHQVVVRVREPNQIYLGDTNLDNLGDASDPIVLWSSREKHNELVRHWISIEG